MIKVIVSHDVDHLFASDHWLRDLIYPKMWIRTTIQFIKREITLSEWWLRNISCIKQERHNLVAQMKFDEMHGIKSTFFFGMNQGLGMSYKPLEAKPMIQMVHDNGFSVGVHGIEYKDLSGINLEHETFIKTMGFEPDGIRMHYVRFHDSTFENLNESGYRFDCTEFDKKKCGTRKNPYKIGKMWEFPLTIMDGYLPQEYVAAQKKTLEILEKCQQENIEYISILFHDYQFCKDYKGMRDWYIWLMEYIEKSDQYEFMSYLEAIDLLNQSQISI